MLIQTERGLVPFMPWVVTPRVAPKVLQAERELVLQLNASAQASNELREATNQLQLRAAAPSGRGDAPVARGRR